MPLLPTLSTKPRGRDAGRRVALLATTLLGAALGILLPGPRARAASPVDGPYVDLGAGYNLLADIYAHPRLTPENQPATRYRFGEGFVGAGALGWGFGNGLRVEVEGAYDYNVPANRVTTAVPARADGNQGTYGVFGNVFYDLDPKLVGINEDFVHPYAGVGAGVLWTHFAPFTTYAQDNSQVFRLGGTGANFAYQGIVGLGFPIGAVPGLTATVDYRLIGIQVNSGAAGESFTPRGVSKGSVDLSPAFLHQFTVGLSYAFFHPAPPAPPAPVAVATPPAQVARTYLVFFDWDRSDLTGRARQVIGEAAAASSRVQTTRIEVNGYTDRTGSAGYNQALSVRRARSVQAELVRDGVPAAAIAIHGYGETNPLVPTADGVGEPQNRRVEIILH